MEPLARLGIRWLPRMAVPATLLAFSCHCPGSGGDSGNNGCPVGPGAPLLVALSKAGTGGDQALLYTGSTSTLPSSCINRADFFEIVGSAFPVMFVGSGDTDACLSSTVVLGPNGTSAKTKATGPDMMKVFGDLHPKLPLSFTACVRAGGNPPDALTVSVAYTTTAN